MPLATSSSIVLLTLLSSGSGNFLAAQNLGLALSRNFMEALTPLTTDIGLLGYALHHNSMLSNIFLPSNRNFLLKSTTEITVLEILFQNVSFIESSPCSFK